MIDERPSVRLWLAAATLVAAVATVWSLWLSLGLGLVPCDLCWYQRILMYPLVAVLGVAAVESRSEVDRTALALSVPGIAVAAYHSWIQYAGAESAACSVGGGCAAVQYEVLGLSTPNLSLVAFAIVVVLVVSAGRAGG
ncbi:disulfide bond formation protein B [Natronorarus salvus]|uniref:disulfide bond formation protein B n=1 Tax=Natronorarus salvus TaxID=3117733 RepID=UPI002F262EB6